MRRRNFIRLAGATALGLVRPGYAETNSGTPVVGLLMPNAQGTEATSNRIAALRAGFLEQGFIEGKNYSLVMRFADGDFSRLPSLAMELDAFKPKVIVTAGAAIDAARSSSPGLPLVFTAFAADPIARGLAESYVRPGGMITGNVMNAVGGEVTMTEKRIGFFKELVPDIKRIGMIATADALTSIAEQDALRQVSGKLGFEVVLCAIRKPDDLEGAFASGLRQDVSAFYISGETLLFANLSRVMTFVAASRKPSVGTYPDWGRAGLLMSYATDPVDGFRRAGAYAAKILHGAKPGELPIEQASKFSLVVNQKTAKALGIVAPATLLALADEVIE